ncbi:MAG: VCBS repeat-containing protein [Steroidobacteraceae bacterium]
MKTNYNKTSLIVTAITTALVAPISHAAKTCEYTPLANIATGARTAGVIALDLNKDKVLDIVATNQAGGSVSVALGKKGGSFGTATTYPTSTVGPYETAAADFNGDGYPDLMAGNFGSAAGAPYGLTVSVFINKGDGTFKDFVDFSATDAANDKVRAVTVGDFNKDGKMDIAAASQFTGLHILLGKGDGTFAPHVLYPAGGSVHGIVAADFNKDGNLDVALANNSPNGAVNVLLGKGDGSFGATIAYPAGAGTFGLATGDLNGDGYPDIVTANDRGTSISVLLNLGKQQAGAFAAHVEYPATKKSVAVSLGDLDGDGKLDVLSSANSGAVTDTYRNNGDGTFQASVPVATGNGSYGSAAADFNGDGVTDIASANVGNTVVIMQGACK